MGPQVSKRRRLSMFFAAFALVAVSIMFGTAPVSAQDSPADGGTPVAGTRGNSGGGGGDYYDDDDGGNHGGGGHDDGHGHGDGHDHDHDHDHGGHHDDPYDPGGDCDDYTPTALMIDVPRAQPGQTVTVSGIAVPGTTVVVSIGRPGTPYQQLGTAVVDPTGHFSVAIVIPTDLRPGRWTIRVFAPSCPAVGTITIVIVPNEHGSCANNPRVVRRGETVTWNLFNNFFNRNRRTRLTLVPRFFSGRSFPLYSGPYPESGTVTFTVPRGARDGFYWVVQTGRSRRGGYHMAKACKVRVRGGGGGGGHPTTTIDTTTTTDMYGSTTVPSSSTTVASSTTVPSSTTAASTTTTNYYSDTPTSVGSATSTTVPTNVLSKSLERPITRVASETATRSSSSTSSGNSSLARTGSTVRPFIVAALLCIGVGGLLVLRSRRR